MLGVDVGKAERYGTWRDPVTEVVRWHGGVPNTEVGIRQLLRRAPESAVVLEPTGRYGEELIRAAQAEGRTVYLAPRRQARAFLWAVQSRAKTDRVDSAGLALYGLRGRLRPYTLPSDEVDDLQQLLAARRGLSQSRSALGQQEKALPRVAATFGPAIAALTQQIAAIDQQLHKLSAAPKPAKPKKTTTTTTASTATTATSSAAVAAAPASPPGAAALVGPAAPPPSPVLAAARTLRTVPGVGPVVAAALAARLVEKQFTHPDQFVAYLGLDIKVHQSGQRKGQFGLAKHGDAELRRLLYIAALAAAQCKHDRTFATRYAREKAKGLANTAALNAVARKLAKVAWSLVTHRSTYNPARVDQQPPKPEKQSLALDMQA
jgi:transposase